MQYVFNAPEPEEMSKALKRLLAAQKEYDAAMKEMRRVTFVPCFAEIEATDEQFSSEKNGVAE